MASQRPWSGSAAAVPGVSDGRTRPPSRPPVRGWPIAPWASAGLGIAPHPRPRRTDPGRTQLPLRAPDARWKRAQVATNAAESGTAFLAERLERLDLLDAIP